MNALEKAIEIITDGNQTKFAKLVSDQVEIINSGSSFVKKPIPKMSQQLVSYYLKNDCPCAPHFAQIISNLTKGEVTMHELRPDVFPPNQEDEAA